MVNGDIGRLGTVYFWKSNNAYDEWYFKKVSFLSLPFK